MPRRLTLAHALSTGQPNLPIQIHSENPPALPVTRKGKGGRLLRRPQQAHPAATVADFRTAVLTFVAFPDLTSPDLATSVLLASDYVPPVLGVIVMVGILAAAVSTIDSILLTLSSMVARDVYGNVSRDQSDHRQLWVGKLVIPVISLLALGFAAMELSLISILSVAASAGLVVTVPAIVGAFFWKRGTAAGALVSIAGGGLFVIVMYLTGNKLFGYNAGILGLPVSTLLFVGVSLVTRPSKEVTEGFISEGTGSGAGRVVNAG